MRFDLQTAKEATKLLDKHGIIKEGETGANIESLANDIQDYPEEVQYACIAGLQNIISQSLLVAHLKKRGHNINI